MGVKAETLGNWIKRHRIEHPGRFATEEPDSMSWAEHRRAVTGNAPLKQENEFLGKVSVLCSEAPAEEL